MKYNLSIIIPIYNVEKYLVNSIESVLNQKIDKMEVILVDDGSTDGCYEICEKYRDRINVQIIHKENGGLVSARKAGVVAAQGMYIGFVDGDDWVEDNYFANMIENAIIKDPDIVCSGYLKNEIDINRITECRNYLPSGDYRANKLEEIKKNVLYNGNYYEYGIIPTVWSKIFKKQNIEKWLLKIPNEITIGEDVVCTMPIIFDACNICILNDNIGYHYRATGVSMSRSFPKNRTNEICNVLEYFKNIIYLFENISDIRKQYYMYASFLIKHVIKGTAINYDYVNLREFSENKIVKKCLLEIVRQKDIPERYRWMYQLMYRNKFRETIAYYRMMYFLKEKHFYGK